MFGGERYLPALSASPLPSFTISRASTEVRSGSSFPQGADPRPCQRCPPTRWWTRGPDAREYRATNPGLSDEPGRAVRDRRPPLDLSAWARATHWRSPADPLPPRLRRPLPGSRQGSGPRAARARGEVVDSRWAALAEPARQARRSRRRRLPRRVGLGLRRRRPRNVRGRRACQPTARPLMAVPEEETVEGTPRQAPRAARNCRAARERVPELPPADAAAPRMPDLRDAPARAGRSAPPPVAR